MKCGDTIDGGVDKKSEVRRQRNVLSFRLRGGARLATSRHLYGKNQQCPVLRMEFAQDSFVPLLPIASQRSSSASKLALDRQAAILPRGSGNGIR